MQIGNEQRLGLNKFKQAGVWCLQKEVFDIGGRRLHTHIRQQERKNDSPGVGAFYYSLVRPWNLSCY